MPWKFIPATIEVITALTILVSEAAKFLTKLCIPRSPSVGVDLGGAEPALAAVQLVGFGFLKAQFVVFLGRWKASHLVI